MNGAPAYAPHHHPAYVEHHHMPPPPYPQYQHYSTSMMPPHVSSYAPHHPGPPQYAYAPHNMGPIPHASHYSSYPHPPPNHTMTMTLPAITAPQSSVSSGPSPSDYPQRLPDTTGQVSPPGSGKPKVTATLWEDEGTLCFQVEAEGICVARRQDNSMINGTKLLNVAHMTRGRRDGILKSEKNRKVIKIGPMHLKGVWISYDRALEFANKEKITESLYPLFVHNIDELLHVHQPSATSLSSHGPSPVDVRVVLAKDSPAFPGASHGPTGVQHHATGHAAGTLASQPSRAAGSQSGRPSLDRAHTYPTPPNNASNALPAGSSYEYSAAHSAHSTSSAHQQFADSKSMPTTPATTPPENNAPNVQQQYAAVTSFEVARNHSYSAPPAHQSPYGVVAPVGYTYTKTEMGPPVRSARDGEAEAQNGYDQDRPYSYQPLSQMGVESGQVSPHTKNSPRTVTGHSTPLSSGTGAALQGQWHPSYSAPQRTQTLPSSSLSYSSGNSNSGGSATNGYPAPLPSQGFGFPNRAAPTSKRSRDADDDDDLQTDVDNSAKRRRPIREEAKPRMAAPRR